MIFIVCPVTRLNHWDHWKGKFKCVFSSLALRVNQNKDGTWHWIFVSAAFPFNKKDLNICIWFSSTVVNHKTFLSSFITHDIPETKSLIACYYCPPACQRTNHLSSFILFIFPSEETVSSVCLTSPPLWDGLYYKLCKQSVDMCCC